jgi:hypothetical protein
MQQPILQPPLIHLPGFQPIKGGSRQFCSRHRLICLGLSQSPAAAAGSAAVVVPSDWVSANHRLQQPALQPSSSHLPGSQHITGCSKRFCSRHLPICLVLSQSTATAVGSAAVVGQSYWVSANLLPQQPVSQPSLVDLTWSLPITGRSSRFRSRTSSSHLAGSQPNTGCSSRFCSRRRFIYLDPNQSKAAADSSVRV